MPANLSFYQAKRLSRQQGVFFRREGWVNADLTDATHWFAYGRGGLAYRVAPEETHVVRADEYDIDDLRAKDWTTLGVGQEEPTDGGSGGSGGSGGTGGTGGGSDGGSGGGGGGGEGGDGGSSGGGEGSRPGPGFLTGDGGDGDAGGENPPGEPVWPGPTPPQPSEGGGSDGPIVLPGGQPQPPPTPADPPPVLGCPECYILIDGDCVRVAPPECEWGTFAVTAFASQDCGVFSDDTANIAVQVQGSGLSSGTYGLTIEVGGVGGPETFSGGLIFGGSVPWTVTRLCNIRRPMGSGVTVRARLYGYSGAPGQCSFQPPCGGMYSDWSELVTWTLCCEPPYNEGPIVPSYCA